MKRVIRRLVLASLVLAGSGIVWAEDTVYIHQPGKKTDDALKGVIESESPSGLKLKTSTGVKEVPAAQITQVTYESKVGVVDFRRPDGQLGRALAEKNTEQRTKLLHTALAGYHDLAAKLRSEPKIQRYLHYRLAVALTALARDEPARREEAIAVLKDNQKELLDGWEAVPALQLLARLQEEKGDTAAASQTYSDLAEVPGVSAAMKLDSQLRGARLLLRVEKFNEAENKLKQVAAAMPPDDPQRAYVAVYLAQSQIAQKHLDGIEPKLRESVFATDDKKLRALAHNALGDYYRAKNDRDRAFWEYLKVETMYDVDREEQAKALYYLAQLFDQAKNDLERAEQCRTKLQGQAFDGTLYQRLAASQNKKP